MLVVIQNRDSGALVVLTLVLLVIVTTLEAWNCCDGGYSIECCAFFVIASVLLSPLQKAALNSTLMVMEDYMSRCVDVTGRLKSAVAAKRDLERQVVTITKNLSDQRAFVSSMQSQMHDLQDELETLKRDLNSERQRCAVTAVAAAAVVDFCRSL